MFRSARMNRQFTSKEVIALTGITARQLQWWDERGIVVPAREGRKRLYSLDEVTGISVICELRQRGFSLQKVRKVARFLQRELGRRLVEIVSARSEFHLLTDGRHIFLQDSAQQVVDVLKNCRQPMLAICLSDTVKQLQGKVKAKPESAGVAAGISQSRKPKAPRSAVLREEVKAG